MEVRVPQADGEIAISHDGVAVGTWPVRNHVVSVKPADLDLFIRAVEGSKVEPKPGSEKEK